MRAITTVGTETAQPGEEIEVADNEAPGLLAQGFIKPLPDEGSDPGSEDASGDDDASEMDARSNEESTDDIRDDQEV